MPVYHNHKLIHIHIPKTAGTAIESFFHRIGDMEWGLNSWLGQEKVNGRWYEFQHLSMMELRSLAESEFPGFRSFAVVRDPYTRLISDFIWRQWIKSSYPNSPTLFFNSFDDFLQAIPKDINTHWSDHVHGVDQARVNFLIHVRPQYQFILDQKGNCLVDDVLSYENLCQDLPLVLEPCGLHAENIRSPQIREPDEYFSREQIKLVNEIYARDFDYFPYSQV